MWFSIVYLTVGLLLLHRLVIGHSNCKAIDISKKTQHFDETIDVSSFTSYHNGELHSCVWLKSGNSGTAEQVRWTGRFQIRFSRYRSACANATVQIIYSQNGVTQTIEMRPSEIGYDRISSENMLLDLSTTVSLFCHIFFQILDVFSVICSRRKLRFLSTLKCRIICAAYVSMIAI